MSKPRWSLLPWRELAACVEVLTFGATKHGDAERPDWQRPERGAQSHLDAATRHLAAIHRGELRDPETGELHAIHAALRLLMVAWHQTESSHGSRL